MNKQKIHTHENLKKKDYSTSLFLAWRTIEWVATHLSYDHLCQGNDSNALITHTFARVSMSLHFFLVFFFFFFLLPKCNACVDENTDYWLFFSLTVSKKYCERLKKNWNYKIYEFINQIDLHFFVNPHKLCAKRIIIPSESVDWNWFN